jgi:hypothetical protein
MSVITSEADVQRRPLHVRFGLDSDFVRHSKQRPDRSPCRRGRATSANTIFPEATSGLAILAKHNEKPAEVAQEFDGGPVVS